MRSIEGHRQFKNVEEAPPTGHNTEIVGMNNIITSAALLESRLGLSSGDVTFFQIGGSTIYATIAPPTLTYQIPFQAFKDETSLYSYNDLTNICDDIGISAFQNCSGANNFTFNGASHIGTSAFQGCTQAEGGIFQNAGSCGAQAFYDWTNCDAIDLRLISEPGSLGGSSGDDAVFFNINTQATITLGIGIEGKGGDGDYNYLVARGCTVNLY